MSPTLTIVITVLGCGAFWEVIKALVEGRHKKKFNIDKEIMGIKEDVQTTKSDVISVKNEMGKLSADMDVDRAVTARVRILRFADEMGVCQNHTKDSFDQVLTDIDTYLGYCADHPRFKNNQTAMSCQIIKDQYAECERERTFLNYSPKKK